MSPNRARAAVLGTALALVVTAGARRVQAGFSAEERGRLARGEAVVEETEVDRGDRQLVGGVVYLIVEADCDRLSTIARDVSRFHELLPHVDAAQLVDVAPSGVARVRIAHSVGPMSGGYTLKMAFSDEGRSARFSLDKTASHDVDEVWGFLRLTPLGGGRQTLVTWGILFDLGPGVLRALFESRIRAAALSYPRRLADAAAR
ncbi:MAG: hypothetical protein NVSMB47_18220 [Polyangiales bacterium]